MEGDGDDPGSIRAVAVTAEDVVAAVEARQQRGAPVVLRVTPPFSGRVRARLHVESGERRDDGTVHVDPTALLAASAPAYPRASETEDELRRDPDVEYSVERHRTRHEQAVAAWREAVRDHFADAVTVSTPRGQQTVDVVVLG